MADPGEAPDAPGAQGGPDEPSSLGAPGAPDVPGSADSPDGPDAQMGLVTIFASQFNSYLSLLWQVPALALTAQSFLLTIALTHDSTRAARIMASGLGITIAFASSALMHNQRGFAITYASFVRELCGKSPLITGLTSVSDDDAEPQLAPSVDGELKLMPFRTRLRMSAKEGLTSDRMPKLAGGAARLLGEVPATSPISAVNVWDVPHRIYHVWRWCLIFFVFAYAVIIVSAILNVSWFS